MNRIIQRAGMLVLFSATVLVGYNVVNKLITEKPPFEALYTSVKPAIEPVLLKNEPVLLKNISIKEAKTERPSMNDLGTWISPALLLAIAGLGWRIFRTAKDDIGSRIDRIEDRIKAVEEDLKGVVSLLHDVDKRVAVIEERTK